MQSQIALTTQFYNEFHKSNPAEADHKGNQEQIRHRSRNKRIRHGNRCYGNCRHQSRE